MFSYIKSITGFITVIEKNNIITVEGIPTYSINRDIKKLWQTDKINKNLFLEVSRNSFSFYSFYALDFIYIIEKMQGFSNRFSNSLRTLNKVKTKLFENTWLANIENADKTFLKRDKLKEFVYDPIEHQTRFFDFYEKTVKSYGLTGMLLAAAPGAGKTLASLMLTNMLDVDCVVVVCPKNALKDVWVKTINTCFYRPKKMWSSDLDYAPKPNLDYYVLHYEQLESFSNNCDFLKSKNVAVILDESHNFNELSSQRTNTFIKMCGQLKSKHTLWLSGTPLKALAIETIAILRTIDPMFTQEVEATYRKIYTGSIGKAIEILKYRLGFLSFKVEKKELELAPPIFNNIKVTMPNYKKYTLNSVRAEMLKFIEERISYYKKRSDLDKAIFEKGLKLYESRISNTEEKKQYQQYRNDLEIVIKNSGGFNAKDEVYRCNRFEASKIIPILDKDFRGAFIDSKSAVKYVGLKVQGEALGRVFGALRIQCHVDMLSYIDFVTLCESTHKKTLVFSSFVQVVEKSMDVLKQLELNPLVVYAKTSNELNSILQKFRSEDEVNPLVATFKSLSTAVPITNANVVILVDAPFRDYILQQAISRVHRIGQDSQTYVYSCSLDSGEEPNISTRSFDILQECQKAVEDMLGIKSPFTLNGENPDEMSISVEGLNVELEDSVKLKPSFLSW